MRRLRTASTRCLLLIVAVLVAAVTGAGIAQAALTTGAKPAPKPLDRALFDAANAKPVEGVTARIKFTNNLLPSGSLPEGTASPALTGASGRLWLSDDGKLRLELQSANGDAQIVADGKRFLIYDAASKQAFTGKLQARGQQPARKGEATLGGIQGAKVDPTPPRGAKVTEIDPSMRMDAQGKPVAVEGVENVQQELDFPLAAPDELAGLPR